MKVKISTQSLTGSTRHLTGAIKIITLSLIIVSLYSASTSALTYQDSVDVSFTFDPTLSISLSSSNISIDSLSPGNYAHSNTVAINVSTNNVYGYTLTAKVGDDGGVSGTSASSNLVNTSTSTSFTSLASNDNLTLSSFSPNTWGYTTARSINNGTTTYSGLLYNTDTTLNMTTGNAGKSIAGYPGTNTTNFTIGASASTDQLAGDYTNIISFTVVTNIVNDFTINNLKYMQDFGSLTSGEKSSVLDSMTENEQYNLIDNRDNNTYTISKLCMNKTGNTCTEYAVWMTQNLDLLIGGYYNNEPIVLTSENTDLNQYDTSGAGTGTFYADYAYNNGIITWIPTLANTNATVTGTPAALTATDGTTVTGWVNSYYRPYLMEGGDMYSVQGTRYNSLSACENNGARTEEQCMHYHVGNYYNFTAAVAMSSTGSYTSDNTVMPNSICPKGWRLPNGLTNPDGSGVVQSDFNRLLSQYGIAAGTDLTGSTNVGWATNGYTNISLAPLFFARSGYVSSTLLYNFGTVGHYWSSTVNSSDYAYSLAYNATDLYSANRDRRYYGWAVHCMAR